MELSRLTCDLSLDQAAPGYGGYQAQPAPAQAYNPPPASTYQQTYTAPTQTYAASTAVQTSVPSYSTAQGNWPLWQLNSHKRSQR